MKTAAGTISNYEGALLYLHADIFCSLEAWTGKAVRQTNCNLSQVELMGGVGSGK